MTTKIEISKDTLSEKLDELSDLCEYWKRHRDKMRTPQAIRHALLMMVNEITMIDEMENKQRLMDAVNICNYDN